MNRSRFALCLLLMHAILLPAGGTAAGLGAVLNVKFTPYQGDSKSGPFATVPGQTRVYINNVPFVEQEVHLYDVIAEDGAVGPAVWVAVFGPVLRKGRNKVRIEFTPSNPTAAYRTQVSWGTESDSATSAEAKGAAPSNNQTNTQTNTGIENKPATRGKFFFERDLTVDTAADLPWHLYEPVKVLTDQDKKQLTAALANYLNLFQPNFDAAYAVLDDRGLRADEARKIRCLEEAYSAKLIPNSSVPTQLEFVFTGNPEVVVRRKGGGNLFLEIDLKAYARIKDEGAQDCARLAIITLYPNRMAFVHDPAGGWRLVY